ncbi:DUF6527 family protein [Streptomyces flaveolus]|uniref:DUF6527 family protein n=1 Tax=Streptomyces flaveolus TaxID=67297 RepID=UPI0037027A48
MRPPVLLRLRERGRYTPVTGMWSLTYDVKSVSLTPSVGNWALRCQAHCWLRQGKIPWSRRYSATEIAEICHRDHRQLDKDESRKTALAPKGVA